MTSDGYYGTAGIDWRKEQCQRVSKASSANDGRAGKIYINERGTIMAAYDFYNWNIKEYAQNLFGTEMDESFPDECLSPAERAVAIDEACRKVFNGDGIFLALDGIIRPALKEEIGEILAARKQAETDSVELECSSSDCAFNHNGTCRYRLVHEKDPDITEEDGCRDFIVTQ